MLYMGGEIISDCFALLEHCHPLQNGSKMRFALSHYNFLPVDAVKSRETVVGKERRENKSHLPPIQPAADWLHLAAFPETHTKHQASVNKGKVPSTGCFLI